MPFEAQLNGRRGSHLFHGMRRRYAERGDITESVEALSDMTNPTEFVEDRALDLAQSAMIHAHGPVVGRAIEDAMEAVESYNPFTYVDRLWNNLVDDMVRRELISALTVCIADLRTRTEDLGFVVTHYAARGIFNGMFEVSRAFQTTILSVRPEWEPNVVTAKLVKKMNNADLRDWGHLVALCHMLGAYCDALSGRRYHMPRLTVGLNYYDM